MISLFDISNSIKSIFGNKLHALICAIFSEPFFKLGLPDTIFGPGFDSICPINCFPSSDQLPIMHCARRHLVGQSKRSE